jgi:HEAT repeat protein
MNARLTFAFLALITTGLLLSPAQAQDAPPPAAPAQQTPVQPQTVPAPQPETQEAAPPPPTARQAAQEPGQNFEPNELRAWSMLTDAAKPGQSAHDRVQAMAALGTMGSDERASRLIEEGMTGKDSDVRIAAILAAGLTKNPRLTPALSRVLDDDNPEVAYTAAMTLWKMHDYSGEDFLIAAALGDQKVKPGLIKASKHKAVTDLHSPKTMTILGLNASAGFFLGPFGVGLKAIEYANKPNGAAIARAAAIDQLTRQHNDQVHDVLIADLTDPEPAVRAAAAKGLGRWPEAETERQMLPMFGDNKLAVRLTAAATYLRALHHIPTPPDGECEF